LGKFSFTDEISCDADTFWKIFLDKSLNEKVYLEDLEFVEFSIIDQRETQAEIVRQWQGQPSWEWIGPVTKLFGVTLRLTEQGRLDAATKLWTYKWIPNTLSDKVRVEGSMRIEPAGNHKVIRIIEVEVEARIFGLGGLMESVCEKRFRQICDRSGLFMNRWIANAKAS